MHIVLVPKLQLGNPEREAPASRDRTGSWSFQDCVPKLELGNERKHQSMRALARKPASSTCPSNAKAITAGHACSAQPLRARCAVEPSSKLSKLCQSIKDPPMTKAIRKSKKTMPSSVYMTHRPSKPEILSCPTKYKPITRFSAG